MLCADLSPNTSRGERTQERRTKIADQTETRLTWFGQAAVDVHAVVAGREFGGELWWLHLMGVATSSVHVCSWTTDVNTIVGKQSHRVGML